jgi:uncharacterized protein
MTCPKCGGEMVEQRRAGVSLHQCGSCESLFLDRADLGDFVEQENDWHTSKGPRTAPLPRITPGMTPPPVQPSPGKQSRSFIDALFG